MLFIEGISPDDHLEYYAQKNAQVSHPRNIFQQRIYSDPDEKKLAELFAASEYGAANWIKDLDTGETYYWPASDLPHKRMAKVLSVERYDKGVTVQGDVNH